MSPSKPARPCPTAGCANLTPCAVHPRTWRVNSTRGKTAARGYGAQHKRWRRLVLAQSPTCAHCGAMGTSGDHADHVIPLHAGGDWSLENSQRLCFRCHARKSMREGQTGKRPKNFTNPRT